MFAEMSPQLLLPLRHYLLGLELNSRLSFGSPVADEVGWGHDQWLTFNLHPAPTRLFGQQWV